MDSGSISSVVLLSQVTNLVMGFIGAAAAYGILKFLDWINGTSFLDHMDTIETDAKALAFYRGVRFAAILIFVAMIIR